MEDFNSFAKNNKGKNTTNNQNMNGNLFETVNKIAHDYDGKNANELLNAIYKEAKKGKQNGTLSNAEIDQFANTISPFLDDKKRKILEKVVKDIKKI